MDTQNPTKSNPILPAELLRPIVDSTDLPKADLRSIALASRILRDEAQRVLFREVGIFHITEKQDQLRESLFFSAILSSPHRLAKMVRVYTQYIDLAIDPPRGSQRRSSTHPQVDLFDLMMWSLEAMTNLEVLRTKFLGNDVLQDRNRGSRILDCLSQCRFRLKEFAWNYKFDALRLLEEFLIVQEDIHTLELAQGFDLQKATDDYTQDLIITGGRSCPRLESLRGPTSASTVLLPGKSNVAYVACTTSPHYTDGSDRDSIHATRIQSGLGAIKYLEYDEGATTGFPLHDIAPYLTSLVVLKVSHAQFKVVSELRGALPALVAVYFYGWGHPYISDLDDCLKINPTISRMFILHEKLRCIFRAYCLLEHQGYRYITCRYTYSRETGKVMLASGKGMTDTWWRNRVDLVNRIMNDVNYLPSTLSSYK